MLNFGVEMHLFLRNFLKKNLDFQILHLKVETGSHVYVVQLLETEYHVCVNKEISTSFLLRPSIRRMKNFSITLQREEIRLLTLPLMWYSSDFEINRSLYVD